MSLWRVAKPSEFKVDPTSGGYGFTCPCGAWFGLYPTPNDSADETFCEDCGRSWRLTATLEVIDSKEA